MTPSLLLVEDDEDARASLTRSLTRAGYSVLGASSVDEALTVLSEGPFLHVVVSDLVLGREETGGLRLLGELQARELSCPVVLITAFASLETVKRALNQGAAYLLEKPFRASELVEVLARVTRAPVDMSYVVDRALVDVGLTDKELSIARLVLKGLTSNEIARLEQNSDKTIRQHITRIYTKCGVTSRPEFFHFVFPW